MIELNSIVYDLLGEEYKAGKIIAKLNTGLEILEVNGREDEVIVEIIKEGNAGLEYKLSQLFDKPFSDLEIRRNILWPIKQIGSHTDAVYRYAAEKPHIIGALISLKEFIKDEDRSSKEGKKKSAEIGLKIAEIYKAVHDTGRYDKEQGCVFGIILQPLDNFFLDYNRNVFFFDTFRCICGERNMVKTCYTAPELLMEYDWRGKEKITGETDAFVYALILFQILTGEFPYCVGRNVDGADVDQIWDRMCDGESIFYYEGSEMFREVSGLLNSYSESIYRLFQRCFDYCGQTDYTWQRPAVEEWINALTEYIDDI